MTALNKKQLSNNAKWEKKFSEVQQILSLYKRPPFHTCKNNQEKALAKWITHQNYLIKKDKLPEDRKKKFLSAIPQTSKSDKIWHQNLKLTFQFIKKNNRIPLLNNPDEAYLGLWYQRNFTLYNKKDLPKQRYNLLQASGLFDYKFKKDTWQENYNNFQEFVKKHGRKPRKRVISESSLAHWYTNNKRHADDGKLNKERQIQFLALIDTAPKRKDWVNSNWTKHYDKLFAFTKKYNRLPKSSGVPFEEVRLYNWLSDQKKLFRKNSLSEEQINKLKFISFETFNIKNWTKSIKSKNQQIWFNKLDQVKEFKNENNRLPKNFNSPDYERKLGEWCRYQNRQFIKGKLEKEKISLLHEVGILIEHQH